MRTIQNQPIEIEVPNGSPVREKSKESLPSVSAVAKICFANRPSIEWKGVDDCAVLDSDVRVVLSDVRSTSWAATAHAASVAAAQRQAIAKDPIADYLNNVDVTAIVEGHIAFEMAFMAQNSPRETIFTTAAQVALLVVPYKAVAKASTVWSTGGPVPGDVAQRCAELAPLDVTKAAVFRASAGRMVDSQTGLIHPPGSDPQSWSME